MAGVSKAKKLINEAKKVLPEDELKKKINEVENPNTEEQGMMLGKNLSFQATEAYKLLRTNLMFTLPDSKCKVVGITSSTRGEGKSTTALNLAYSVAQAGKKVLLIDGDMRIPTVAKRLCLHRTPGLSNVLASQCTVHEAIQKSGAISRFFVMPAGNIPPNPNELLGSQAMTYLIRSLMQEYEFILIDLPPINLVSDAIVISKDVQGLIMTVREGYSSKTELNDAISKLNTIGIRILGFVLTDVEGRDKYYRRYRYGKYKRYYRYSSRYGKRSRYGSYGYRAYKRYGRNSYQFDDPNGGYGEFFPEDNIIMGDEIEMSPKKAKRKG